jgi:hypothetical protein
MLKCPLRWKKRFQGCRGAITLPASWFGSDVPSGGDTFSFFEKGVKTGAQVYQEDMLQGIMKPLNTSLFNGQEWVFQQDSSPAHTAKTIQEWLERYIPAFISAKDWPLGSPRPQPPEL